MTGKGLICRHCGRPIAVPLSECPWPDCGKTIMAICAACKQYTDNRGPTCQECGKPLVVARFENMQTPVRPQPALADLAADQKKVHLVASGVIAEYTTDFFFADGAHRSVLVDLVGAPLTPLRTAEALILGAVAYLVQHGCVDLQQGAGLAFVWRQVRPWDGQEHSLEGQLATRSRLETAFLDLVQQTVADAVGLQIELGTTAGSSRTLDQTSTDLATLPLLAARARETGTTSRLRNWAVNRSNPRSTTIRAQLAYPTATGVIKMARQAPLPPHERAAACRQTYRMLLDFVRNDPKRADALASEIGRVLRWFQRCEEDPSRVTDEL